MVDVTQILSQLQFTLRRLGWQAQVGLALWIFACLLAFGLVPELQMQRDLEAKLIKPMQKSEATHKALNQDDITQRFYALLPKKNEVDTLSERILYEADGIGLQFVRAEFSEVKHTETTLTQHLIKLPVRGNYVQIRQFLNGLLNTQPALALTEFKVRRDDVFTDLVEANLVLTLYLRGDTN